MKKYIIGNVEFTQNKVSLKNLRSIITILSEIEYPQELTVFKLLSALGNRLPEIFALILNPNVPIENLSKFLDENIDDEQTIEIIEDFLSRPFCKRLIGLLPNLKP